MSHLLEGPQTRGDLQIGIEVVALGSLAGRLAMQVAFGHAHIIGAVQAVARAGRRLGNDRDGSHAACRATRLHAERGEELTLKLVIDVERLPGNRILLLELKVVREHAFLGIGTLPRRRTLVVAVEDLAELDGVKLPLGAYGVEYVDEHFVHDARFYRFTRWYVNRYARTDRRYVSPRRSLPDSPLRGLYGSLP